MLLHIEKKKATPRVGDGMKLFVQQRRSMTKVADLRNREDAT